MAQSIQNKSTTEQKKLPIPPTTLFMGMSLFIVGVLVGFVLNIIINASPAQRLNWHSSLPEFITTTPEPTQGGQSPQYYPTSTMSNQPSAAVTANPTPTPSVFPFDAINAKLCIGRAYTIPWTVPGDTGNIGLTLYPSAGLPDEITTATNVGTPTSTGEIQGSYQWIAGKTMYNNTIVAGPGYRLLLDIYSNGPINKNTGRWSNYFSLTHC